MNRAHTQFAPPQAHSDIDLPLFDLAISEPEEQMMRRSALEQADTGADAVAAPSASTRHHSSAIFPSLPPAAASALSSSHMTGACCAHASRSEQQQQQQQQQQQSASRSDEDDDADSDSDPYGTRIPLSRLVDLVFASPAELIERAELEMEMLHQIQASPASKARLYSEAATIPALMQKNRYSNIIPTRAARVILPSSSHSSVDSPSRYINACLLPPLLPGCAQPYIAAQAPLPHTVAEFWHMIWAQRSGLVVMLTAERERDSSGRVAHKAHPYWPEQAPAAPAAAAAASSAAAAAAFASSGEGQLQATASSDSDSLPSTRYGPFTVTLLSTRREPDFIVRELLLSRDEGEGQGQGDGPDSTPRRVHQIQYTGWPDFGVPDDQDEAGGFLRIFSLYRALRTHLHNEHAALSAAATAAAESRRGEGQAEPAEAAAAPATAAASPSGASPSSSSSSSVPPVVVHCSAGIGRSGVWIAIDALLDALSGSQPPRSIDLFALVCRMREARQGMLQTKEQYAYVLHFLATCMHKRRFGVAKHGN